MSKADVLTFASETLEQMGNEVKNVSEKLDSLKESSQDEGQCISGYRESISIPEKSFSLT